MSFDESLDLTAGVFFLFLFFFSSSNVPRVHSIAVAPRRTTTHHLQHVTTIDRPPFVCLIASCRLARVLHASVRSSRRDRHGDDKSRDKDNRARGGGDDKSKEKEKEDVEKDGKSEAGFTRSKDKEKEKEKERESSKKDKGRSRSRDRDRGRDRDGDRGSDRHRRGE